PVQWIRTQDSLLRAGVVRFIEIGPQPTLAPMLKKSTLDVGLEYLWSGADQSAITCAEEGVQEEAAVAFAGAAPVLPATATPAVAPAAPVAVAPVAVSAPAARVAGSTASIPLSALHALRVLVSLKLKLPFADLDTSKSVKTLAGGKSA